MKRYSDLPFASTLCGSCSNVCPVKIDIHDQLYKWRQEIVKNGHSPAGKTAAMNGMAKVLASPWVYRTGGKLARWVLRYMPWLAANRLNPWYKQREMPEPPLLSFGEWYAKNRRGQ
jgi:L-lactate dehydrogenase complex protein LldF